METAPLCRCSGRPHRLARAARPLAVSAPHARLHQVRLVALAWATSPSAGSEPPLGCCVVAPRSAHAVASCVAMRPGSNLRPFKGEGTSVHQGRLGHRWQWLQGMQLLVHSATPNPSIERTCHGRLRLPRHAAHVER